MTASTVDLYELLPEKERLFLDSTIAYRLNSGLLMEDDDDDDDDDDEDDGDDDDPLELGDDDKVKVKFGGKEKVLSVAQLKRIGTTEKRQGRKAGRAALLKDLGYESEDDLKEAIARIPAKKKAANKADDDADDDAAEASREEARRAEQARKRRQEEEDKARERRFDLRGALRDAGVSRDDLDDAFALLDRKVDDDYDDDELDDAVEEFKASRAGKVFFDDGEDEVDEDGNPIKKVAPKKRTAGGRARNTPTRRNAVKGKKPGDEGRARAKRMFRTTRSEQEKAAASDA
jgi:hypothetical protein